jgi:uncharacterized membrane protein (UPF0136 family)
VLYGIAGYLVNQNKAETGHLVGVGASVVLTGIMGKRLIKTGKFMPAGMLN